ncbi:MAG TPA: hypothetical protein V6C81_15580 [Planktothrix sp.]|jgi:hypothetical protein
MEGIDDTRGRMPLRAINPKQTRSDTGQMMGVADLVIVIPATILCFFFLTNTGLSVYYKGKLGNAADQAAIYASHDLYSPDVNGDTTEFINQLFTKMSVPVSKVEVKVDQITVGNQPAVSVNITSDFDLLKGSPLPYKIRLSETSVTVKQLVAQQAVHAFVNGHMRTVYIPLTRRLNGMPTLYNPHLVLTDEGADMYKNQATDLQ